MPSDYYFEKQLEPAITQEKPRHVREVWFISTEQSREKHYSQFPEALVNQCIDASCPEGGTVCDPFMGSSTTGVAALRKGRNFIGIDISPEFVEVARQRLKNVSIGESPPSSLPKSYSDNNNIDDDNDDEKGKQTTLF